MTPENKDSTKAAETEQEAPELSPEELSKVIEEEDPEFSAALEGIKAEVFELIGDADVIDIESIKEKLTFADIKKKFGDGYHKFRYWPFFRKLTLILVIVSVPSLSFYFYYISKKDYIHPKTQMYMNSFEELAQDTYEWDPEKPADREVFFGSLRLPLYVYNLKKLIVNLKTSSNSPSNAMIALELVAEGTTPEAATELKERESFFRDLFQQELSQMSYDRVAEPDGKEKLIEQLRRAANEKLEQGKIRKLYLKNIILKK